MRARQAGWSRLFATAADWLGPAGPVDSAPRREIAALLLVLLASLPLVTARIYASDEINYFSPLRSLVKDGDLDYTNEFRHYVPPDPRAQAEFEAWIESVRTPTGRVRNVNPVGSALLWAPAYVAVDAFTWLTGSAHRTGFEQPYVRAVAWSSALYGFAGLALVYGFLRRRFDRSPCLWTIAAVGLGTNLLFYLYVTPPMSHTNSFFLAAVTLVVWAGARESRSFASRAALGGLIGLATMVREQDGLLLILPVSDAVVGLLDAARRRDSRGAADEAARLLLCLGCFALAFTPQLLVYRALSGALRPHGEATGKMLWTSPQVFGLLFSGWHGFFAWSPLAFPGLVGLVWLAYRAPRSGLPPLLFFLAETWTSSAYATWEAGASFGARRLIVTLPMLAWGWAYLAERLIESRPQWRLAVAAAAVLGIVWNVELIVQYSTGMISRNYPVSVAEIAHNQVFEVPPRLPGLLRDYVVDRGRFYEQGKRKR